MDALHLPLYQFHQTPPAAFVGFRTVCIQAMDALHLLLYQFHQTPPAAFVGFRTVYSQAMDAVHLLLYQFHQTPPAAFVGFRTVYSQAMDALHLLLYQIHQTPPAAFVGFRTVYSQAMDAVHLLLYQFHQSPTIGVPFYCMLVNFGGFGMVSSQNAEGVKYNILCTDYYNLIQGEYVTSMYVNSSSSTKSILSTGHVVYRTPSTTCTCKKGVVHTCTEFTQTHLFTQDKVGTRVWNCGRHKQRNMEKIEPCWQIWSVFSEHKQLNIILAVGILIGGVLGDV